MFIIHEKQSSAFPVVSAVIDEADTEEHPLVSTSLIEPLTWFFFFLVDKKETGMAGLVYIRGFSIGTVTVCWEILVFANKNLGVASFSPVSLAVAVHTFISAPSFPILPRKLHVFFPQPVHSGNELLFYYFYNPWFFLNILIEDTPSFIYASSHYLLL